VPEDIRRVRISELILSIRSRASTVRSWICWARRPRSVLQDAPFGLGEQLLLVSAGRGDAPGEVDDRRVAGLVGHPDDDHVLVGLPLGVIVVSGRGQLGLERVQSGGESGLGRFQRRLAGAEFRCGRLNGVVQPGHRRW
jgi:hypothetical protein